MNVEPFGGAGLHELAINEELGGGLKNGRNVGLNFFNSQIYVHPVCHYDPSLITAEKHACCTLSTSVFNDTLKALLSSLHVAAKPSVLQSLYQ